MYPLVPMKTRAAIAGYTRGMRRAGPALVATLLLVASAAAQAPRDTATRPDYRGTGVVLAVLPPPSDLHPSRPVIVIEHEPIAGLMDERMSMPFIAASTTLFQGLRPGDRIAFGLKDTPGALLVIFVERLPAGRR
jgi:Cu/Ag efflux protein CusF